MQLKLSGMMILEKHLELMKTMITTISCDNYDNYFSLHLIIWYSVIIKLTIAINTNILTK